MKLAAPGLLVVTAFAAAACESSEPKKAQAIEAPRQSAVITREGHRLPAPCRVRPVARLVIDFFYAFNNGDEKGIDAFLAQKGFQWYAVNGPRGTGQSGLLRDGTMPYFRKRHERREFLRAREIRVNWAQVTTQLEGWEVPPTPVAAVELRIDRKAEDIRAGAWVTYHGKAELNCQERTILKWTIFPEPTGIGPLCPKSQGALPPRAALACG